jgi:hypothetical protein
MNEGTRSGKSTIRLLGISAERPTNGLYTLPSTYSTYQNPAEKIKTMSIKHTAIISINYTTMKM